MAACPHCQRALSVKEYDAFEDMWHCFACDVFMYPSQVGERDNMNAGIFKMAMSGGI
jgi:hypothetical protein